MTKLKLAATLLGAVGVAAILAVTGAVWVVRHASASRVYDSLDALPANDVGLVLGTSACLAGGKHNLHFDHRMDAAAQLFRAGKVHRLLLSGNKDPHDYDEPADMKAALLARGVPAGAMILDGAGFRTLDSVVRAHVVYGQNRLTVVTDRLHAYRAIFLAEHEGVDAVAFPSREVDLRHSFRFRVRECGADFKACLDLWILHTQPRRPSGSAPARVAGR